MISRRKIHTPQPPASRLFVAAAVYAAVGLNVPSALTISTQIAVLERSCALLPDAHGLRPVAANLAIPDERVAARADQHPCPCIAANLAVHHAGLPLQLHRQAEPLSIVQPASANQGIAIRGDGHLGQAVA